MEFETLVAHFKADLTPLERGVDRGMKLVDKLENRLKNFKGSINLNAKGGSGNVDVQMRRAQTDIARMQKQTAAGERALTRQIEREAELQTRAKMKAYRRAADESLRIRRQEMAAERRRTVADQTGGVRSSLSSINALLGISATAVAGFVVKSAMNLEEARNKFTALEGSVEKANERIQKLLNLSRQNVGVNFGDALQNFAQLQAIGGVAETNINKIITALGRLDVAFKIDSQEAFLRNLTQIFTQGFERADIKEAIGRVPIFEQLIEKAFGTKDAEKLKGLKESGKLTLDAWIAGIAEAVQTDTRLAGLKETFGSKLSKALTEVNINLAPLGDKIIGAITPVLDDVVKEQPGLRRGWRQDRSWNWPRNRRRDQKRG